MTNRIGRSKRSLVMFLVGRGLLTMQPKGGWLGRRLARVVVSVAALWSAGLAAQSGVADDDTERLFDWAEATYPQHFPGHATTLRAGPYLYRHYPSSGNYVGAAGIEVYVLGPISGGALTKVGELGDFRCLVRPTDCSAPHPTRVFVGNRTSLLERDGRVVRIADLTPVAGSEAIPGSAGSRLPVWGRKVVESQSRVLAADGTVTSWAGPYDAALGGTKVIKEIWPEKLVDLSDLGGLTADGTVLVPTAREFVGNDLKVTATLRLQLDQPVRQLEAAGHVIYRDGSVARVTVTLPVGGVTVQPIRGTADVRSVACSDRCLALRTDGRVLAWGTGPLGDGSSQDTQQVAVLVQNLSSVRAVAVMSSGKKGNTSMSLALRDDGQVWVWGAGFGVPGNFSLYPDRLSSIDGVTDVACISSRCVLRRVDGTIWGWGLNQLNELGNFGPPTEFQREPVQARGILLP